MIITNREYYLGIENQIHKVQKEVEVKHLLPIIEKLYNDAGVKPVQHPIEGYYGESPKLARYFQMIRSAQISKHVYSKLPRTEDYLYLKRIIEDNLFGTQINPMREHDYFLRKMDLLALSMNDEEIFDPNTARPWTIDKIWANLEKHKTEYPNLSELAYMTGVKECLVFSSWTNALYRDIVTISGCCPPENKWAVDPKVEEFGEEVIKKYNEFYSKFYTEDKISKPGKYGCDFSVEYPKTVWLGEILATNENYFWTAKDKYTLEDYYA